MPNDRLDTEFPKIVLDKEDREAFQRTRQQTKGPAPSSAETKVETKGGSPFSSFMVYTLIIALGGFSYWQYTQNRQQGAALQDAESRLLELERRLSATGEELDQSAVAMQVKVGELSEKTQELWTQMDRLWASAWRRNQADIKALDNKMGGQRQALEQQISVVESDVNLTSTNIAVLQEQLDAQQGLSANLSALKTDVQKSDSAMKRELGDVQAKLVASDQVNSALTRRVAELEKWKQTQQQKVATTPPSRPTTATTSLPSPVPNKPQTTSPAGQQSQSGNK